MKKHFAIATTSSLSPFFYSGGVMRGAFVIRLGRETQPTRGLFEGWVEEVDSGEELRFRSTEELLAFLGHCFCATYSDSELCWRNPSFDVKGPEDPQVEAGFPF
jgi:hypothetical protein